MKTTLASAFLLTVSSVAVAAAPSPVVPRPDAMKMEGVPQVPLALAEATRPYLEYRTASLAGWNASDRSMLIQTRFGNTAQLHVVKSAGGARQQISFEQEPANGSWSPNGDVLLVSKDVGGSEFYQLYTLSNGRLRLLTDGKSRNEFGTWSKDGSLIGYSSTRRNGADSDLYVMDPRDPSTDRLMASVKGGGWNIESFTPDKKTAIVRQGISATKSNLWLVDVATGKLTPLGNHSRDIAFGTVKLASDGRAWTLSDEQSDTLRLGTIDLSSGKFVARSPSMKWDIEEFDISSDGRTLAFLTNEAGVSRLYLLDTATGSIRRVDALPSGVASNLEFAPWGEIGLTLSSARIPADAFAINPTTLAVTRWTESETGGLDAKLNVEPELVSARSFDGEPISGFLYRPDPAKFPGKRPLLMWIHGGPESQARPSFLGRYNYLMNELGIAMFYPNVRGSSGYGKRFISLDNGPFLRENSVKDIGALLSVLKKDESIDASRIAQTGRSYGGYMCYASAIFYPADFKSANCVVAISDFVTFLKNTQSYRRDLRRVEYGDERDPKQLAQFKKIAPMARIGEIKMPLYIVAGENDPRVPASEARQVAAAVKQSGTPVWVSIAANEGHQWGKKENVDYQFWTDLLFWQQTLLGQPAN
ncbi:S9 family peptidase [Sphingomonas edaphi]|uniref:S9 family peptidase n=2 Tax=Sphingomonas edaphi TaxID=2315689 RepID=A0A418PYB5_9SPHN|nr:S9 family peptidase [Sphingomonas edaphi]